METIPTIEAEFLNMLYSLEYNPKYGQIRPNKSEKMDFMELYNFRWVVYCQMKNKSNSIDF